MASVCSINVKNSKGSTGVELQYYESLEFMKVPNELKDKLGKCWKTNEGT